MEWTDSVISGKKWKSDVKCEETLADDRENLKSALVPHVDEDINTTVNKVQTALHSTVLHGSQSKIHELIATGADVNRTDNEGKTGLFYAVQQSNNESAVCALIDAGADVNRTDNEGETALFYAVQQSNNERAVCALIAAGADVNRTDNWGKIALFYAVHQKNNERAIRTLIEVGADVNITDNKEKTALFYAVQQSNNESVVCALIDAGANVNKIDNEGKTALFYAVQQSNNESVVQALIDAGADVNRTDNEGKTALFYAVQRWYNESVVCVLIDAGADVNRTDNEGKTALFYAVQQSNNESVVSVLIDAGANVNRIDNEGKTALIYAVQQWYNESVVCALIDAGADVKIMDNKGKTALFYAVQRWYNESVIHALIAAGADVKRMDNEGKTALFYAVQEWNSKSVIHALIDAGADVNKIDNEGKTALFYTVQQWYNKNAVCALIDAGADVNRTDNEGKTALFYAAQQSNSESVVGALIDAGADVNKIDNEGKTALFYAVQQWYNKSAVCAMIDAGADVNRTDEGETAAIVAVKGGKLHIALKLINAGADVQNIRNITNKEGKSLLMLAVEHGRSSAAIQLIQGGADVNIGDKKGKTALIYAVVKKQQMVVHTLINAGADVNRTENEGKTALFYAVQQSNNESVVQALIDAGADVNRTDNEGKTALIYAVQERNNKSVVHALIDAGADVNRTDNEGKTALIYAVQQSNNESVVRELIAAGADVNITDNEGNTTLFYAVQQSNNESAVSVLIAAGADVNRTDNEGNTALFYAVQRSNNESVVCVLIDAGADVNITDNKGKTALLYAVQEWNNESVVRALIDAGTDVNRTDNEGNTTLFYAVQQSNIESMIHALIDAGANANRTDKQGKTALFYAVQRSNNESVVHALIDAGANVNKIDNEGKTALFYAVQQWYNESAVCALIDAGADVNITDNEGKTALIYAVQQSNDESVVCVLIDAGTNVNITDNEGNTALFYAVQQSYMESVIHALIDAGANANRTDNEGKTALFYAVQQSNKVSVFPALIDAGADVNVTENERKINHVSLVHALIDAGTDVNITDNEGKSVLIYAVQQRNNESVVRVLIDAGADVNITDNERKTALFYAVQEWNNESVVCVLIDAGADVNITDNEGNTALFYAIQRSNNESVVHALIEKGNCFSNPRDSYGRTPIFYAMEKSLSLIRYLLQKKSNVHIKDNCNMSILSFFIEHCVTSPQAFYGSDPASYISKRIDLLLGNGVKRNAVFETIMSVVFSKCPLLSYSAINGKTINLVLELAKTYITEERELKETKIDDLLEMVGKIVDDKQLCGALMPKILDLLFELGADPNSSDSKGNTALHYATCLPFYGMPQEAVMDILRTLEGVGVTFNAKNHQNETPLLFCLSLYNDGHQDESSQCSVIKTVVEVCRFLLQNGSNVEDTTRKGDSVFHLILRFLHRLLEWYTNPSFDIAVKEWVRFLETLSFNSVNKRVVNKVDANLNSPLHLWALLDPYHHCFKSAFIEKLGFLELSQKVLAILLKCGANFNARNENGETPVHLCTTWTAVNLLLDAGANPSDVDSFGRTPLLAAAKKKTFLKIQEAFFYPDVELEPKAFWKAALEKRLDPWVVDRHGESVLSILIESGAVHLAIALIEVAQLGNYLQCDSIAASLLNAVCRDRSACAHWKINLVKHILKSSEKSVFGNVKENSALDLCFRNIMEASKRLSVDKVKQTVHWKISRLLLSYGAYCGNPDDIVKACPEALGELLFEPVDLEVFKLIPWNSVVKRYQSILEKVSKGLESAHIGSFWYHQVPLQRGSFGMIFAGINEIDGREVAIKRIEKLRLQQPEDKREITHLTALADCEQVVRYLGFFEDRDFSYIVLELMEGNLNDYLNPDNNHYVPTSGIPLCKDLVQGLKYLHSQSILHRDLKPTNILYKIFPKLSLKIADFGLSRHIVGSTSSSAYGSLAGTRCWIAPEVLKSTNAHSRSSDVFSCGLILYYILSVRKHPFAPDPVNKSELQISNETEANILNGHHTEGWDDSLCPEGAHLIKQMLDSENSKRPSADKALDHPFFWTKQKKVNLLIAVGNQQEFECPRAKRKLPLTTVESDLELNFGTIVKPHGKWNDPGYVHMPAIYSEMMKKRKTPYDTKSVVELVRFIRNATVRVSESTRPQPIRKLLLEDFVFLEYFPNLVMEVYKAVTMDGIRREKGSDKRDHGWDQTRKEIKYAISKK